MPSSSAPKSFKVDFQDSDSVLQLFVFEEFDLAKLADQTSYLAESRQRSQEDATSNRGSEGTAGDYLTVLIMQTLT